MDMGDLGEEAAAACKISMLWNWNTIDSCFISNSWHVRSRGGFAGSCIGVFFLVVVSQWLHRFSREYDSAIIRKRKRGVLSEYASDSSKSDLSEYQANQTTLPPLFQALSHKWLFSHPQRKAINPDFFEQVIRTVIFTLEWGLLYIIMLLFMYYNGYIIISCILGALFGKFIFTYNEPLSSEGEEDRALADSREAERKCCM